MEHAVKIEFACPTCKKRLVVDETLAGKMRACPKCQDVIEIPSLPEPAYEEVDPGNPLDDTPPKKPRNKPKQATFVVENEPRESWFQRYRSTILIVALSTLAVAAIVVILLLIVQKTKEVNATPAEIAAKAQKLKEEQLVEKRNAQQSEIDSRIREQELKENSRSVFGWLIFALIILMWIAVALSYIVFPIIMYRDSVIRGMPNGVVWVALGLIFWIVPFIIFVFARPQSRVVRCGYCGNKSLWYKPTCLHCEADIEQPA